MGERERINAGPGLSSWFLGYADECYATTRFCFFGFFQNAVFRMAHHSLEYYMKAFLGTQVGEAQLKDIGHRLPRLVAACEQRGEDLGAIRPIINYIGLFERLRYPRTETFTHGCWGLPFDEFFARFPERELQERVACFNLDDFDRVVGRLRLLTADPRVRPVYASPSELAREFLFRNNRVFTQS